MSQKFMGNKKGMTLIETVVAIGIFMVVGGALTTLLINTISMANAAKIRTVATRLADQKMEQVKMVEQTNKMAIQGGNFTSLNSMNGSEQISLGQSRNFFTRATAVNCTTTCSVSVVVSWAEKGKTANVTLNTIISKWL